MTSQRSAVRFSRPWPKPPCSAQRAETRHGNSEPGSRRCWRRCAMRIKAMWSVAQSALGDWWNDNCMRLSASLAFYTALSLAPLVIIVVGVAGLITERQQVAAQLEQQIRSLMGPASQQLVHTVLATT